MSRKKTIIAIIMGSIFVAVLFSFYSTFSLETNYQLSSDVYKIENNWIKGISPNTEVSLFMDYFDFENCSIKVVDDENKELSSGYVPNGSKTLIEDINHKVIASYTNIILGDITKDGIVDNQDLSHFGKYLVEGDSIAENILASLDIDSKDGAHLSDLLLLDQALQNGYQDVVLSEESIILQSQEQKRIVAKVTPNYGLNQNLKWSSKNEQIATVQNSGIITGHQEGETIVQAQTMDGTIIKEVAVKVDNTIQLSDYEGVGYVNGNPVEVNIKLVDYKGVSCNSSNENIASCQIKENKLILTSLKDGTSTITVTSPTYGSATYQFTSYAVYFRVMPNYLCTTPRNVHLITVTGFHQGKLSFSSSDDSIIKSATMTTYQGRNMLQIEMGEQTGRATLKVTEDNGNSSSIVTVDTYRLSIPAIGATGSVGEWISTEIVTENVGTLSCSSSDAEKATCSIEGNQLKVMPTATGDVTITVKNTFSYNGQDYECGETTFLAVIR